MAESTLESRLQSVLQTWQGGALAEAARMCRELTAAYPRAADAWHMFACLMAEQEAWDPAAEAAEHATKLQPGAAVYWLTRGKVAAAQRREADAQQHFERAAALDPQSPEAHYRLALTLHRQHRTAEAVAAYRLAARSAPDVADIHWQLADALVAGGDVEAGLAAYERAFALDPQARLDRRWCFECMTRLRIDTLPPFWQTQIEQFFQRTDVDKAPYVALALKALRSKPAFGNLLGRAMASLDDEACAALSEPLLHALLRDGVIPDAAVERSLTHMRRTVLMDAGSRDVVPLTFLALLALQCFHNEYAYVHDALERASVEALAADVREALTRGTDMPEEVVRVLLVLGCYRSLEGVAGADSVLSGVRYVPAIDLLHRRSIADVRTERALRTTFRALTPIDDDVSRAVRGMYEENPYPRWTLLDRDAPLPMSEWLAGDVPAVAKTAVDAPRVLVAGCGTGQDALWIAANVAGSKVLAMDLSLSSLGYAARRARELQIANIEFVHGDILELNQVPEQFDLVVSTGVLHHMRDPQGGLTVLARCLRSGGLMKLGLYSARARGAVNSARAQIATLQVPATADAIRDFRQQIFASRADSPLKAIEQWDDFYSLSMCRDLLFHVEEHQFTLPRIGEMLAASGLELVGLSDLPQEVWNGYRRLFPDDVEATHLAHWDEYEALHPATFRGMFLFWCRPAPQHVSGDGGEAASRLLP